MPPLDREEAAQSRPASVVAGHGPIQTDTARVRVVIDHSRLAVQETDMSKGMDRKRDAKKKPAKTLMEKRAAKKQKKANKPFQL